MKKLFFMLLMAALWSGSCNDSEADDEEAVNGGGSETQQPILPSDILPKRIVSADVTFVDDDYSFVMQFDYDGQGRLVATERIESQFQDSQPERCEYTYEDSAVRAHGKYGFTTYRLENGRIAASRYEETGYDYWHEAILGYDTAGYLVSIEGYTEENYSSKIGITYTSSGFVVTLNDDECKETASFEYDKTKPNNLNIDLYGWNVLFEYLAEQWMDTRLLGLAGERFGYLPSKMTLTGSSEEDGKYKSVSQYDYHYKNEYLSEIEEYFDGELLLRVVLHYE